METNVVEVEIKDTYSELRLALLTLCINEQGFIIVNIYAPNIEKHRHQSLKKVNKCIVNLMVLVPIIDRM